MITLHRVAYRADTKNSPVYYVHLSDMQLSTLEIGAAASLRYRDRAEITAVLI